MSQSRAGRCEHLGVPRMSEAVLARLVSRQPPPHSERREWPPSNNDGVARSGVGTLRRLEQHASLASFLDELFHVGEQRVSALEKVLDRLPIQNTLETQRKPRRIQVPKFLD